MDKCDVDGMRLHATGLQTFCKLVENEMNNLPCGYSYARGANNSPLLKLIFPNMLRVGRNNTRALDGPVRMPRGPGELMKKVEKAYAVFYKLWNITMVPMLMKMHKWFDGKAMLRVGDIVYFRKRESELSSKWTVGKVTEIVKSKDDVVRRCTVQYQNSSEDNPRYTDRAARSLVKLFNIDDVNWQQEMDLVEKLIEEVDDKKDKAVRAYTMNFMAGLKYRLKAVSDHEPLQREVSVQHRVKAKIVKRKMTKSCGDCCCYAHCRFTEHGQGETGQFDVPVELSKEDSFPGLLDRSWVKDEEYMERMFDDLPLVPDRFVSILHALNTDLSLEVPGVEEDQFSASVDALHDDVHI